MKKIYLHIGTHKTASTFIQKSLSENHERLLGLGYLYPKTGQVGQGSHHNLQFEITGDKRHKKQLGGWEELKEEIRLSRCEKIIISCEAFSTLQGGDLIPKFISEFAKKEEFKVEVFCYIRPQFELIESLWLQETKSGQNVLNFQDYIAKNLRKPRFDYLELFKTWCNYFKCNFLGFNTTLKDCGIEESLQKELGIKRGVVSFSSSRVNDRVSLQLTEAIRLVTDACWKNGATKKETENLARIIRHSVGDAGIGKRVLSEKDREMIASYFSKTNNELASLVPNLKEEFSRETNLQAESAREVDEILEGFSSASKDLIFDFVAKSLLTMSDRK